MKALMIKNEANAAVAVLDGNYATDEKGQPILPAGWKSVAMDADAKAYIDGKPYKSGTPNIQGSK